MPDVKEGYQTKFRKTPGNAGNGEKVNKTAKYRKEKGGEGNSVQKQSVYRS